MSGTEFVLKGGCLIEENLIADDIAIVIRGDRIERLSPSGQEPPGLETIDVKGSFIAPGFVDLQLNGCGGVLFNDTISEETLTIMHRTNLRSGTTSFFPTLITTSEQKMVKALEVVEHYRESDKRGVLGVHLEGPYINPARKGIHDVTQIRSPSPVMIEYLTSFAQRLPIMLTLAPERVQLPIIRRLAESGVIVSCGHSQATYEEAMAGFDAGIKHATHLFNAMSAWTGREPGLVGAVLDRKDVSCGIIVDGIHVHFASVGLVKKIKQEQCSIVTDGVTPVGTNLESFAFGGQTVYVRNDRCVNKDGTFGGALITMAESVANIVRHVGHSLLDAVRMASWYPARVVGVDNELGRIAEGYLANLAIFDKNFRVQAVVDRGEWIPVVPFQK